MNQPNGPVSFGGLAAQAQVNAVNAQVNATADGAILATLIATVLQKDKATIEAFRGAVQQFLSVPTSNPAQVVMTQQVRARVDAIIDMTQTFCGN
ncbi:hypothetical protein [Burkholderia gladioli]|uniref:hypothetical protein n=1 Tax=Burkholderia gladioli TaxID=28095 RepID=UPI00163E1D23|nr:hypothetical protein [Burkholderia gladioli]